MSDPYLWLEDPDSEQTRAWVREQNERTRAHLASLPDREWFSRTLRDVVERPRAGTPCKLGGRYVVSRNDGTSQQDLWFIGDTLEELEHGGRLLLDPNALSADGTSSVSGLSASLDPALAPGSRDSQRERWLAYQVSEAGSDWTTVRLLDLGSGRELDDHVSQVKFSEVTWLPDDSYLYLHFPSGGAGTGTDAAALPAGRLRRHRVGESQETDDEVLAFPEDPRLFVTPWVSHDGRWLVVSLHQGTSEKNRLWVLPLVRDGGAVTTGEPRRLVDEAYAGFEPVRVEGSTLLLLTDHEAPLRRVVRLDLDADPADGRPVLTDVVAESEHLLEHAATAGDELVLVHLADAQARVSHCALGGTSAGPVTPVDLPTGSVVALHADQGDPEVFLGLTSFDQPQVSYRLDLGPGGVTALDLSPAGERSWTPPAVVTERHHATSADGTSVPYFLVVPEGAPAGPRPTLLWGYGGFGVSETPAFRVVFSGWLAAGGTLAVANLRGGGEFGAGWHEAGRLERKQNVFDDLVAVAEDLVARGATTHAQLALHGRSNGGLLVGAVMTQRPDLAAVALPAVGVLDMLRFHLFTVGAAWISDYGSPEDPAMVDVLRAYSPLHHVRPGTAYPATLVLTGDHDDRVVPAHSFKFTAALQQAQAGDAPVLARIETATGHGAGKPSALVAAEAADALAFAAAHTGLVPGR